MLRVPIGAHRVNSNWSTPKTYLRLLETCLYLPNDPFKGLGGESVLLPHFLGAENRAEEDVEEKCGVPLGLLGEGVVSPHYHQLLAQLAHVLHHLQRVEVRLGPHVNMEHFLGIPDEPTQIHRQCHLQKVRVQDACNYTPFFVKSVNSQLRAWHLPINTKAIWLIIRNSFLQPLPLNHFLYLGVSCWEYNSGLLPVIYHLLPLLLQLPLGSGGRCEISHYFLAVKLPQVPGIAHHRVTLHGHQTPHPHILPQTMAKSAKLAV